MSVLQHRLNHQMFVPFVAFLYEESPWAPYPALSPVLRFPQHHVRTNHLAKLPVITLTP